MRNNLPLNNNRNNRRRGRGNRNQGGSNSANRIDSRARGNAPQLLDKYKKLAQDAQHNGDRVQAEYYLQFADHYFRVISDNKLRQEEARAKRNDERGSNADDDDDDDDGEDNRQQRGRGRRNDNRRDDNDGDNRRSNRRSRKYDDDDGRDNEVAGTDDSDDEPEEAPRKRAPRKPRAAKANGDAKSGKGEIDASILPPAIGAADDGDAEAKPKKLSTRRRKVSDDSEVVASK
ncbi:DUF4167 domain-containing protein [Altererythrobacter sp. MF3-039]|uniref:DUF4167 domain-containing protein n=1 Tax=Altererythrobacter sp. MF3-039 TaxID=3252901 RepID=UPI00390CB92E